MTESNALPMPSHPAGSRRHYQTDGRERVLLVLALFLLRDRPPVRDGVGSLLCLWEVSAPLAFLLIRRYNGTRGLPLGVAFYWFYPAHLLVLGLIRLALFS